MGSIGALQANEQMRRYSRDAWAQVFNSDVGSKIAGGSTQYYDEISETQNYVIGSRLVTSMTVYHYCKMKAGEAIDVTNQHRGAVNSNGLDEQNTSAAPATVAVGSTVLDILDAASAANDYQNGKIIVYTTEFQVFHIVSNDASDGTNVRLYLDRPVRNAIAAGTFTAIVKSPYSAVAGAASLGTGLAPIVCVPQRYVTAGYYFWAPTYGHCGITQGEALDGTDGPDVVFSRLDGAVWKKSTSIGAADSWQHAGHMFLEQTDGIDSNIWLELDS